MKRAKYDIALRDGGRETVTGYVGGDFACRKGRYFWDFTHLPEHVRALVELVRGWGWVRHAKNKSTPGP